MNALKWVAQVEKAIAELSSNVKTTSVLTCKYATRLSKSSMEFLNTDRVPLRIHIDPNRFGFDILLLRFPELRIIASEL